ncbi:MAG: GntR family transcriptional regulator/MocR family aminotransferase [Kiritimatiellia bacterium]|jgi:GntR family transcriptional regulator/MocR family aminotransferase
MPLDILSIQLDRHQSIPLPRQLHTQLYQQILNGKMIYKEQLPATRTLAKSLNVARGVVVACYEMLKADELISGFGKGGTQVSYRLRRFHYPSIKTDSVDMPLSHRGKAIAEAREYHRQTNAYTPNSLSPSVPDVSLFPYAKWQRLSKEALESAPVWYERSGGTLLLKKNLQTYLSQYRGINIDNLDRLLITTGSQASLSLLAQLLTEPGDVALIDQPGWAGAKAAIQQAGLTAIYAPIDEQGTQLSDWNTSGKNMTPRIAMITPSCQFPTGRPMSMARREALVRYTAQHQTWLIEDDYAAEYIYDQHPSPSILAHSTTNHIIHVGSMSKLLLPSLRLGWMVVPAHLAASISGAINTLGIQPSGILQQQLGLFIQHGYLSAHLIKTRSAYNERRRLCSHYLQKNGQPFFTIMPSMSSMNHYLKINLETADIEKLRGRIDEAHLGCEIYHQMRHGIKEHYLLLGHANLQESMIAKELDKLLQLCK